MIGLTIDQMAGEFSVEVPHSSSHQLFYVQDGQCLQVSPRIAALYDSPPELDWRAVYSLFQFGAIVPPWSTYRGIRRFVPGQTTQISCPGFAISRTSTEVVCNSDSNPPGADLDSRVLDLLDRELQCHHQDGSAVVMFSGGIDSGLVAARLAAAGQRNTHLVHHSFAPKGRQTARAERMAKELGLTIEVVPDDPLFLDRLLNREITIFPQPFSDSCVGPSVQLIVHILANHSDRATIFTGEGGDSGFGIYRRIRACHRVFDLPAPLRGIAGLGHRGGLLTARLGRLGDMLLGVRRIAGSGAPSLAAISMNALSGIAFQSDTPIVQEVENEILGWVRDVVPTDQSVGDIWLSQMHFAAGRVVQKYSPFAVARGKVITHPFLQPSFSHFAIGDDAAPLRKDAPKAVLKRLLGHHVSPELIRTSPWGPPLDRYFRLPPVRDAMCDEVLDPNGALAPFLRLPVVSRFVEATLRGQPLPLRRRGIEPENVSVLRIVSRIGLVP